MNIAPDLARAWTSNLSTDNAVLNRAAAHLQDTREVPARKANAVFAQALHTVRAMADEYECGPQDEAFWVSLGHTYDEMLG